MTIYDVAIIGGGIGGLMTAYQIKKNQPQARVIILEKGFELEKRHCPKMKFESSIESEPTRKPVPPPNAAPEMTTTASTGLNCGSI